MSFTGTLLSIEPDGTRWRYRNGAKHVYPVWKITVDGDPETHTAHTGRSDMIEQWRLLVGKPVRVLRGGKEGIVGGVVALDTLAGAPHPEPRACPCLHTTPCHPRCTCVMPVSSQGCRRCCSYGSPEQQRLQAEWLAGAPHPEPEP